MLFEEESNTLGKPCNSYSKKGISVSVTQEADEWKQATLKDKRYKRRAKKVLKCKVTGGKMEDAISRQAEAVVRYREPS